MNVLVVSHLYPSRSFAQLGNFVHAQAKALVRAGCQVRTISPTPFAPPFLRLKPRWQRLAARPKRDVLDGIEVVYPRVISLSHKIGFSLYGWLQYPPIYRAAMQIKRGFGFEIVHSHTAFPDGFAAMLLARRVGCPLVVTVHGADFQINLSKRAWRNRIKRVIDSADRVVVVSNKLRRIAQEEGLIEDESRLVVIHNGFDVGLARATSAEAVAGRFEGRRVVVSVASLIPSKGVHLVLEALPAVLQEVPNLFYLVIGDGPQRSALQRAAYRLGVAGRVEFLGYLPPEEVFRYLSVAEVFVLPSSNESFGIAYLEAMAMGTPVIACRGQGPEDFVEDGQTGLLIPPEDVASLREAMLRLLLQTREARRMSQAARRKAFSEFSWERNASSYIALYEEVVEGER